MCQLISKRNTLGTRRFFFCSEAAIAAQQSQLLHEKNPPVPRVQTQWMAFTVTFQTVLISTILLTDFCLHRKQMSAILQNMRLFNLCKTLSELKQQQTCCVYISYICLEC